MRRSFLWALCVVLLAVAACSPRAPHVVPSSEVSRIDRGGGESIQNSAPAPAAVE